MWIRTGVGNYVNSDNVFTFCIQQLKSGDIALTATTASDEFSTLAIFHSKEDAQKYLDRMMKVVGGRVFEVSMEEWNYSGHKKDHKEKRHGCS